MNRTGRSSQTAFLLHVVSYVARHGSNPPAGHHVSHICDRRNCFNPEHLVAESPQANNSRKGCPGPVFCPEHGHELINLCSHWPLCIRPPRADAVCCLTIKQSWDGTASRTTSGASSTSAGRATPRAPSQFSQQQGIRASQGLQAFSRTPSTQFSGAQVLEDAVAAGDLDVYSLDRMP
jgi:hypothetical protein